MFVKGQDKASEGSFFVIHLILWIKLGLKISDLKNEIVTPERGAEKCLKSVTYYLNGLYVQHELFLCILDFSDWKITHGNLY